MKNKKSKCIAIFFLLLPLISLPPVLAQAADSSSKWDQPFDKPMYLLHTMGGTYYDSDGNPDLGTIDVKSWWILYPDNKEFIDLPGGPGPFTKFKIDKSLGPYDCPRDVCSVAERMGIYPAVSHKFI
jgi:hypothetical protein